MIGSCLGLTAANAVLLNITDLRYVYDIMSSAPNRNRLEDFGVDAYYLNKSLEDCITTGFKDMRAQRRYTAQEMVVRSNQSPERVAKAKAIMQEMDNTEEKGYIFDVTFRFKETYVLLWLMYTLNFHIWPKNVLAQDRVDLSHSDVSMLVTLLSAMPSYSVSEQKLFGMKTYRLLRKNEEEFRRLVKAKLMYASNRKRTNKVSYASLCLNMNNMVTEIGKWEAMVRLDDGYDGATDVENKLADLRIQLAEFDNGELVLSQLRGKNLIASYCKVFNEDVEEITQLISTMNLTRLLEVYDDIKDVVWGLNECNANLFDDCRKSILITHGKKTAVNELREYSNVIWEAKQAIDSASSLFEPIVRS